MEQDRRQYFRIDQLVLLECKVITDHDLETAPEPRLFEISPYFGLKNQLAQIDQDSQRLVDKLASSNPDLAAYLINLDKKITLIGHTLADSGIDLEDAESQQVNLSEGGLSFVLPRVFTRGSMLTLKMVFKSNGLGMLAYGRVKRCNAVADGHEIGVEFLPLAENCRSLLARMVLEAQAQSRRERLR